MDVYARTRLHLHGIAETLIAGPQHRAHGTIRLAIRPGGFGGVALPLAVDGVELVVSGGVAERRVPLRGTARELAARVGVTAGAPAGLYPDGSGLDLDAELAISAAAAAEIESWFALGDAALREFAPDLTPVLWPEHFDLAVTVGEVNYGVSPGDCGHPAPYAYVGPWTVPDGEFWNAPFGAVRELDEVGTPAGLTAFFRAGKAAASG
jgi:hypothetical protein